MYTVICNRYIVHIRIIMLTYIYIYHIIRVLTKVIVPNCIIYNYLFFVINLKALFLVFIHFVYLHYFGITVRLKAYYVIIIIMVFFFLSSYYTIRTYFYTISYTVLFFKSNNRMFDILCKYCLWNWLWRDVCTNVHRINTLIVRVRFNSDNN